MTDDKKTDTEMAPMITTIIEGMKKRSAAEDMEQKLYTTSELCEVLGVTKPNALKKLADLGIEPVEAPKYGPGGHEAFWDFAAYQAAKVRFEEEEEEAKRIMLVKKHVKGLTEEEQGYVVTQNIQALQDRHDPEAMKAKTFAVAAMMQSLMADVNYWQGEYTDLLEENSELRKQLDISTSVCTVETYAINHRLNVSRAQAGVITRKLHAEGFTDEGKIPSKYDNNLPATVWKVEILDAAYERGLFG